MNFLCQGFRKLSYDRHTYRQTDRHERNYIPCRVTGGKKYLVLKSIMQYIKSIDPSLTDIPSDSVYAEINCIVLTLMYLFIFHQLEVGTHCSVSTLHTPSVITNSRTNSRKQSRKVTQNDKY